MTVAMAGPAPASMPAPRLRIVGPPSEPDLVAARWAVADLLVALGRDPTDEHLAETPARVADSLAEMLIPAASDLSTFPNDEGYDELIVARDLPVHSLCQHHLLPFYGVAHVAIYPASGSWACPSWPGWWNCSPATCRCRNG